VLSSVLDLNSCVIRFLNCLIWPSVSLSKIYTAVCSAFNLEKQTADLHDCALFTVVLLFALCQEKNLGSCSPAKGGYLILFLAGKILGFFLLDSGFSQAGSPIQFLLTN